jgi:hypothetical protein
MRASQGRRRRRRASVSAPAKINLHLRVGPPTAGDGFHPISSWMVTVGLFDKLDLELTPADPDPDPADAGSKSCIRLTCDDRAIPTDGSNLVVKAAAAMFDRIAGEATAAGRQAEPWSLSASLHKRIPVGAGLGGGSSDAAAMMIALSRLLGLDWPPQRLAHVAATIGSDLPFFFFGPSSVCTGRGEVVEPTPPPKPKHQYARSNRQDERKRQQPVFIIRFACRRRGRGRAPEKNSRGQRNRGGALSVSLREGHFFDGITLLAVQRYMWFGTRADPEPDPEPEINVVPVNQ